MSLAAFFPAVLNALALSSPPLQTTLLSSFEMMPPEVQGDLAVHSKKHTWREKDHKMGSGNVTDF